MIDCSGIYGQAPSVSPDTTVRNTRESEHIDAGCARPEQDPRAFRHSGSRRQHVIDQNNRPSTDAFHQAGANVKSATHIAPPPGPAVATLGRRAAVTDQQIGDDSEVGMTADGMGQQSRLIVAAGEKFPAVQRHWRQYGIGSQKVRSGAREPCAEGGGGIGLVGVLETQDHAPAAVVVGQYGAGAVVDRGLADASGAQQAVGGVHDHRDIERLAAAGAVRRRDEGEPAPAGQAKRALPIDRPGAGKAARRQDRVQHGAAHASQGAGQR